MFPSYCALRRIAAQTFALLLIVAAAGHFTPARAQAVTAFGNFGPMDQYANGTATASGWIDANRTVGTPGLVSTRGDYLFENTYDDADVTVDVRVTAGVLLDRLTLNGPRLQFGTPQVNEERTGASNRHVINARLRKGVYAVGIGPQIPAVVRPYGRTWFELTVTVRRRQPNPPPIVVPVAPIATANMCNPIPNVGMFGLSATPQVISRANISIGPGEMECYQFTVAPVFAAGRPTILTINNLPPTGTKTITVVNPNGPYPLGPLNTTAPSLYANMTLQPGTYYLVVVVGGNSVSRTNYAWSLR